MWFFKSKKKEVVKSPKEIIGHIIDYIPNNYLHHKQFVLCVGYFENMDYELVLDSLIELANETGHYFSEDFWNSISIAAYQMELKNIGKFCEQQIARNRQDISWKISFGEVIEKMDERHFVHHTAQRIKDEWDDRRRREDNVNELKGRNGVHLKSHGRSGTIYFIDGSEIFEIEYELGVAGLILYFESFINKQQVEPGKELHVKNAIVEWANKTKNAIDFS